MKNINIKNSNVALETNQNMYKITKIKTETKIKCSNSFAKILNNTKCALLKVQCYISTKYDGVNSKSNMLITLFL